MKTYLEQVEIQRLENASLCFRDRLLIRVLWRLGCRVSEALALEVKNIDFRQGTVTIEHLKSRINLTCPGCNSRLGKSHVFCPKCGSKVEKAVAREKQHRRMRTLPIDSESLEILKDYIKRGGPISRNGKELIFGINRHRAWQIIKDCAERANLPRLTNPETGKVHSVSPHKIRDAFAVHAVKVDDSGDSLRLLQEHLGHVSFNTTAKYRKVAGDDLKQWYNKLWKKEAKEADDAAQT
jgi:integrase/recombinase XerD